MSPTVRTRFALSLVALFLVSSCSRCSSRTPPSTPDSPQERIAAHAEALPADTTATLMVGDLPTFADGAATWRTKLEPTVPGAEQLVHQLERLLGVDPFQLESWLAAGLGRESGWTIGLVDSHPVLAVDIADRGAFERRLRQQAERHFDIESAPRTDTVADLRYRHLARSGAQIAWAYRRQMALVVLPHLDLGQSDVPTVTQTLRDLPAFSNAESLASSESFRSVRRRQQDRSNIVFAELPGALEPLTESERPGGRSFGRRLAQALLATTDAAGGFAEGEQLAATSRTNLTADWQPVVEQARVEEEPADWRQFVGTDSLAALRVSVDATGLLDELLERWASDTSRTVRRRLKRWSARTGVDLREEILDEFTGQGMVVLEDVGPDFTAALLDGGLPDAWRHLQWAATLDFQSKEAAESLQKFFSEESGTADAVADLPVQTQRRETRFLIATDGIDLGEFPAGPDDAPDTDQTQRPLRQTFFDTPALAGLYVDGLALAKRFDNRLSPSSLPAHLFDDLDGALLQLTTHNEGLTLDTHLELRDDR